MFCRLFRWRFNTKTPIMDKTLSRDVIKIWPSYKKAQYQTYINMAAKIQK